mgnify:CR=1 FL=1
MPGLVAISVVAFTAVKVISSDQHAIAGNDDNASFVESSAEVFADLIELAHEVLDLLFPKDELFAMLCAMTKSEFNGGLADAALGDARSVVVGFSHSSAEDESFIAVKSCSRLLAG